MSLVTVAATQPSAGRGRARFRLLGLTPTTAGGSLTGQQVLLQQRRDTLRRRRLGAERRSGGGAEVGAVPAGRTCLRTVSAGADVRLLPGRRTLGGGRPLAGVQVLEPNAGAGAVDDGSPAGGGGLGHHGHTARFQRRPAVSSTVRHGRHHSSPPRVSSVVLTASSLRSVLVFQGPHVALVTLCLYCQP